MFEFVDFISNLAMMFDTLECPTLQVFPETASVLSCLQPHMPLLFLKQDSVIKNKKRFWYIHKI